MITLRGKLTRTLVVRPLPIPKATRSSASGGAVSTDHKNPPALAPSVAETSAASAPAAVFPQESSTSTATTAEKDVIPINADVGISSTITNNSISSSSIAVLAENDYAKTVKISSSSVEIMPEKGIIMETDEINSGEGNQPPSMAINENQKVRESVEEKKGGEEKIEGGISMMEEWTWRGVWAFGDLAEEDNNYSNDKNNGNGTGDEGKNSNNNSINHHHHGDDHDDIASKEKRNDTSEVVVPNDANIMVDNTVNNHDDNAVVDHDVVTVVYEENNSSSATTVLGINALPLNNPAKSNNSAEEVSPPADSAVLCTTTTTTIVGTSDEMILEVTAPTKNRPGRKKKKQRKNERPRPTAAEVLEEAENEATKPRPFVYKWIKPVNASEVVVPSALVILVREMGDGGSSGGDGDGGVMDKEANFEEKKEQSSAGEETMKTTVTASIIADAVETAMDGDATEKTAQGINETCDTREGKAALGSTLDFSPENDVVMQESSPSEKNSERDALVKSSNTDVTLSASDTSQKSEEIDLASRNADIVTVSAATTKSVEPKTVVKPSTTDRAKEIKFTTYGDSPFTDASGSYPLGTCPESGKWEGHFENVVANTSSSASSSSHSKKKRSHSRSTDSRVREVFYLFFNATPPHNASHAFSDTDSTIIANEMLDDKTSTNILDGSDGDTMMEDGNIASTTADEEGKSNDTKVDGLLPSSHIHVRGYGTNRFGTFEIVGSLDPATGALKCQRMYVPVPTSAEISKVCGQESRVSGRFILPGENEDGGGRRTAGRKRKSSWKKRESDIGATGSGGEYVLGPDGNLVWTAGSGEAAGVGNEDRQGSGTIDIASMVKKRPRQSYESGNRSAVTSGGSSGVVGGGILKPPPQCRGTDNGPFNLQISSGNNMFAPGAKPSPRAISIMGGGGGVGVGVGGSGSSTKSHKKKSKGVTAAGAQPRSSSSSAYKGMQGSMILAPPPSVVPTLPSAGDPMKARWRAAHYLYFQRVELEPDGEGQGSSWASAIPASGGKSSSSNAGRVKFNYVVYEGEMHDGMRDGRGICLYNNNTLYEGRWKKNKEHGIGKLMTADRKYVIYEGSWEKGKMHGQGTYTYYLDTGNGSPKENGKYVGQFRQNLRNGRGVYTLPNGSSFEGEFRDNVQNGYGIFRWPDGSVYEGPWRDGKRHGAHGILVASDGFRYEGSWVNNSMEGRGVAVYPKGQIYDGTWVAGRREGRGTIRFTNGAVYEGRFKDDYMEGQGTMKMNRNVIIPRLAAGENDKARDGNDEGNAASTEVGAKHDWMIPLQFQSDISHIHQKAGFTQVGL